jgi:hypothetical protein
MFTLEKRLDPKPKRNLDRLTRRTSRRDHDHASGWRLRGQERSVVRREGTVLNLSEHVSPGCKEEAVAGGSRTPLATASTNVLAPGLARRTR